MMIQREGDYYWRLGLPSSLAIGGVFASPFTNDTVAQLNLRPDTEAQGWVVSPNGEVVLTAQAPTVIPHNSELTSATCHGS